MKQYSLEDAGIQDLEPISQIHAYCWRETYSFMPDTVLENRDQQYRLRQWESWFSKHRPREALFTLNYDGNVVGFCMCKPNEDPDAPLGKGEMHAAYILPQYRGGVVGPLMMLKMAKYMKENDLTPPILWAFKQNSIRFWYAQLGWERFLSRERIIIGKALPEYGYIHRDIDGLIKRLESIVSRYLLS